MARVLWESIRNFPRDGFSGKNIRKFSQGLESVAGYKNFFQKNISRLGLKNRENISGKNIGILSG